MQANSKKIYHYFEMYISDCEYSKKLRPKTIRGYKEVFTNFLNHMPEIEILEDLKPYMLNEFFRRLSTKDKYKRGGVKVSTIRTYYNKLIVFFRWLEYQGYIPMGSLSTRITKPPNPTYEDDKALSEEEVSKIISAITLYGVEDSFMYKRDMAILLLFIYTGIRKGELLGLRVQDIKFDKNTVFIHGKTSKSKKSRYIPLHYTLASYLRSYLTHRKELGYYSEALIVSTQRDKPFTEHGLKYWVKKYKKLSGINFYVHRFRHTFACELAKRGADVVSIMKALGHSTVKMTQQYLRSIQAENSRDYINELFF